MATKPSRETHLDRPRATMEDIINAMIKCQRFEGGLDSKVLDPRYGTNTAILRGCEILIRIWDSTESVGG